MSKKKPSQANDLLPVLIDFDPSGEGNLDAESAWRNFGGLSLEEAHSKFREFPRSYQEDFMFMGGRAFAFYYPVIEDYLRELPSQGDEHNDHLEWILAKCIDYQFKNDTDCHVLHLSQRVVDLSCVILDNINLFGYDELDRERIAEAWQELKAYIQSLAEPQGPVTE
jgi:hypothetical protein